jgi:glutathione synthase
MKIAFLVNNIKTEKADFTTILLARTCHNLGHSTFLIGIENFIYNPDGFMEANAFAAPKKSYKDAASYLADLQGEKVAEEKISARDLDVLVMRFDPASEEDNRVWAGTAGLIFGQLAMRNGVLVLNDPFSLSMAINKMYFQYFPESVRPRTLITRNAAEINEFFKQNDQKIILKPLQGSGGKSVFMVSKETVGNMNQIIEAISRDGYVVAQQYIPEASKGDTRLFVMNGEALKYKGKYAAIKRTNKKDDIRSNIHSGGTASEVEVTDEMLQVVDMVKPKLIQDGMFLVGLDIVGDKLLEVNVFSPGGFVNANNFYKVDFTEAVVASIENKIRYQKTYGGELQNKKVATMT